MSYKKLKRSNTNSVIAGVCGGLGDYFDVDPIIFRIIFVVLCFAGGGGGIIYLLLWIFIPRDTVIYQQQGASRGEENNSRPKYENCADADIPFEEVKADAKASWEKTQSGENKSAALVAGITLIVIGCMFMMQKLWNFFQFREWWPIILVIAGAIFLYSALINKSK